MEVADVLDSNRGSVGIVEYIVFDEVVDIVVEGRGPS